MFTVKVWVTDPTKQSGRAKAGAEMRVNKPHPADALEQAEKMARDLDDEDAAVIERIQIDREKTEGSASNPFASGVEKAKKKAEESDDGKKSKKSKK